MPRLRPPLLLLLSVLVLAIASARRLAPPLPAAFGLGPQVVLVHGLGGGREDWLPTARRLARHHRVTLVDLPGHGLSEMPEPFSLERAAAAVGRSLDQAGGPAILVGHSLGGLIAVASALRRPERIRGLVLVETALRPQIPEDRRAEWLERLEREYPELLRAAYLDFGRDPAQGEALHRRVAALDPRMVRRWIRLAWTADLSQRGSRLTVPVLAVLAERSWSPDEPWAEAAEALGLTGIPDLRAARVAGCGHFLMLDRPDTLAALIERFAARPEGLAVARR